MHELIFFSLKITLWQYSFLKFYLQEQKQRETLYLAFSFMILFINFNKHTPILEKSGIIFVLQPSYFISHT